MAGKRVDYIYIRVFATLLVVIGHCWFVDSQYGFDEHRLPGMSTPYFLDLLCRFIYSFHMSLFFALSGSLMALGSGKSVNKPIKAFVKKKAWRLISPFMVVTTFYCIPIRYITGVYSSQSSILHVIKEQYITLIETHLWFLPCLFFVMLLTLIIQRMRKKKVNYPLLLVFAYIVHVVLTIFNPCSLLNAFMFRRSFEYLFPFMLGYLIFEYNLVEKVRSISKLTWVIFGAFLIAETLYLSHVPISNFLYRETITILAVFLFFIIASNISKWNLSSNTNKLISYVNRHSFEIFLYHAPINYLILRFCELNGGWDYPNWIFFWLRFAISFCGSLLISQVVRVNYGQR